MLLFFSLPDCSGRMLSRMLSRRGWTGVIRAPAFSGHHTWGSLRSTSVGRGEEGSPRVSAALAQDLQSGTDSWCRMTKAAVLFLQEESPLPGSWGELPLSFPMSLAAAFRRGASSPSQGVQGGTVSVHMPQAHAFLPGFHRFSRLDVSSFAICS